MASALIKPTFDYENFVTNLSTKDGKKIFPVESQYNHGGHNACTFITMEFQANYKNFLKSFESSNDLENFNSIYLMCIINGIENYNNIDSALKRKTYDPNEEIVQQLYNKFNKYNSF